jgi:cyclic pyranopterin phosphate synthase
VIEIYTDGACLGNPGGPGGWGVVIVDGPEQRELSGAEPRTTNQRMEITAAIKGLEGTPPGSQVKVVSDSQYVVKTMTRGWQRKANLDLWVRLDDLVAARRVAWEWVRGHNGHPMNELADRLANGAAKDAARRSGGRGGPAPSPSERRGRSASVTSGSPADPSPAPSLSHVDVSGKARMVDVSGKDVTEREAVARGAVVMRSETLRKIRDNAFEKGDVLGTARVAGVMAAKRTHELIPLCHPIPLTQVTVDLDTGVAEDRVEVTATARAAWKTGVEMEALTAVAVAALTIYDMCKSVDRGMKIEDIRLVRKSGGKSGDYAAED